VFLLQALYIAHPPAHSTHKLAFPSDFSMEILLQFALCS